MIFSMILLLIETYFVLFSTLSILTLIIIALGVYYILTRNNSKYEILQDHLIDLSGIAGEDLVSTQLDLAKAYLETNQITLAKSILREVLQKGNALQKQEAQKLFRVC